MDDSIVVTNIEFGPSLVCRLTLQYKMGLTQTDQVLTPLRLSSAIINLPIRPNSAML